jgi:hypothetical protein
VNAVTRAVLEATTFRQVCAALGHSLCVTESDYLEGSRSSELSVKIPCRATQIRACGPLRQQPHHSAASFRSRPLTFQNARLS